ncbi:hypothetical protein [Moraxella lincolnii]|uniref:hypothetical protein n=1 Tax=Lwoffella lincolnii TaxID=90241 RepID=UPI0030D5CE81
MADTHHEVANNPIKEISYALIGTLLFLAMVLWIAIAAYMRPAGDHHTAETLATTDVATELAETTPSDVASDVAVADRHEVNTDASAQLDNATIVDESDSINNDAPADATATTEAPIAEPTAQ